LGYLLREKNYVKSTLLPTEVDSLFSKTLVKGWVRDENAALKEVFPVMQFVRRPDDLAKLMALLSKIMAMCDRETAYFGRNRGKNLQRWPISRKRNRRGWVRQPL